MLRFSIAIFILSMLTHYLSAQQDMRIITGITKDITTNTPIADVMIISENSVSMTYSDDLGKFTLEIPLATKTINASRDGYDDMAVPIGDETDLIVALMPQEQLEEEPLTGLSWSAPFIFWGGLLTIAIVLSLWFRRRKS